MPTVQLVDALILNTKSKRVRLEAKTTSILCLCFAGLSGPCDMDNNGDRLPYFWFYQYLGEERAATIVAVSEDKNRVCVQFKSLLLFYYI